MKKLIFILMMCCMLIPTQAQETYGALNTNFSPTNSVHINPSSMLDAKTWLDIHVVGAGAYINNDFAYGEKTTLIRLLRERDFSQENFEFQTGTANYHAYNRNFVQVLSGVWSQGDHAAGLSFGAYSYTDARRIDEPMGRFIENGITQYTAQHLTDYQMRRFRANSLAYGEAKISYAYTFHKRRRNMFMGGISYKKIFPLAGGAASIRNLEYNVYNDTVLHIDDFTGDAMANVQPEFSMKGGWGFDLGFTYQRMYSGCESYYPNSRKGGCTNLFYKYKIAVSINDLGYAKFNPDNVSYVGYNLSNVDILNYADLTAEAATFPEVLAAQEATPNDGEIRDPNRMSLPTSISIQYDRNILPHFFYVNATLIHGIPPTKGAFGPRRAHSLAVTPRIETKWFDAALPISLYEYQKLQLGLSLRFYVLTIGTDKLLNFFVPSDIYGADFYFHLKVPLFRNPKCGNSRAFGSDRKGGFGKSFPKCDAYR
ncbi:MAG: hypothetical protein GQ574_02825 [Crocinitomix sp.]|nr:hypothetical protein [Crocinitomix sp.]